MKTLTALFFSTKYWTDPSEMDQAITALSHKLEGDPVVPVIDGNLEEAVKYARRSAATR